MIEYANLFGGLITCQFPYLVMMGFGVWFAKQGIFHKEGAISFSKLMIEIFIPIYLFINIARSTSVILIKKNYLMIISVLSEITFAALVSIIYIKIVKMDIRYRYSFLILNCFSDIKNVHRLIINSFCYHLRDQTQDEKDYCSGVLKYNFVHMFFQSVIIWYVAFNFIRIDRKFDRNIKQIQSEINGETEKVTYSKGKVIPEKKEEMKEIYSNYITTSDKKTLKVTPEFYNKASKFFNEDNKSWWREIIYIFMRPPLIAMFTGFIVGFISPVQTWIFNTTTAVYLFYDTFNTIGNSHIICAFIIIGTNLYIQENENIARFTKKDFIAHLVLKCVILPFFGVIFSTIAQIYIPENRVLNFASFVQWIMPTSIDIITIIQAKDVNAKDISICIAIQWVWFTGLSNFVYIPPFLKAVNLI